jgi:hypothetical protein
MSFIKLRRIETHSLETTPPEQRTAGPPCLPSDIWWIVLEMFLYPGPNVMEELEPSEIHAATLYFQDPLPYLDSQVVAQRMATRRKRKLRRVCKSWKEMSEKLTTRYRYTPERLYTDREGRFLMNEQSPNPEYTISEPPEVAETSRCTRLLVKIHPIDRQKLRINFRYTHPVSNLTLRVFPGSIRRSASLTSLSDIISFPEQLKILNLYLEACKIPEHIFKDLQEMPIPLTTLSLFLKASDPLQTPLMIPTLASLFLSVPSYERTVSVEHPMGFGWTLPALRNLSLIERYTQRTIPRLAILSSTHAFFAELLAYHMPNIQSLLIHPMTLQVSNPDSPLCWKHMPNLQTLATNFSDGSPASDDGDNPAGTLPNSAPSPVRHLIHFHLWSARLRLIIMELIKHIRECTRLETVRLVLSLNEWSNMAHVQENDELRKLCQERGIIVWWQDNAHH